MATRILGLDPGLTYTGWGVIVADGPRLKHVANGRLKPTAGAPLSFRLNELFDGLTEVIHTWQPDEAAVEIVFMNKNPESTLKLGQARGVVMLAPARSNLSVDEYGANQIKKSVVGAGHAGKDQVQMMVETLLPGVKINGPDAADALAVAICHAHHRGKPALNKIEQLMAEAKL